ncbi:hypothetical protein A2U01_0114369, partial [Trifolium medium]|nr:hypothetical protein [Trifolium medium]
MNCATRHIKLRNSPRPEEIHFNASQHCTARDTP